MRFAYIDSSLPVRSELSTGAVDAEWLLERSKHHDITAVVDSHGAGPALLEAAGVEVMVSAKRAFEDAESGRISAEHALVNRLAEMHADAPFDMVVFGSSVTTDASFYHPTFSNVPQVAALGGGPLGSLRLIADDPGLAVRHGRQIWATVSRLAAADAVLGRVGPAEFGAGPAACRAMRLDPGGRVPLSEAPPNRPDQIALVALTEDQAGFGSLISRLVQRVELGANTTIVAIVPYAMLGGECAGSLVVAGCPEHLQTSTIVVTPDADGSAAAFLATSDLIVAARPGDLSVNAIVDAVGRGVPAILLEGSMPVRGFEFAVPPSRRPDIGERVLVPFDGGPHEVAATLASSLDAEMAIIHTSAGAAHAVKLAGSASLGQYDLAVLGKSHPISGQPSADEVFPELLAVHRDAVPSILRSLPSTESLWELVVSSLALSLADRVRLAILPAPPGVAGRSVPANGRRRMPSWVGGVPLMPRLNLAGSTPPVPPPEAIAGPSVRDWVKTHRWSDRARLALPWKWGVLRRAMRDRW